MDLTCPQWTRWSSSEVLGADQMTRRVSGDRSLRRSLRTGDRSDSSRRTGDRSDSSLGTGQTRHFLVVTGQTRVIVLGSRTGDRSDSGQMNSVPFCNLPTATWAVRLALVLSINALVLTGDKSDSGQMNSVPFCNLSYSNVGRSSGLGPFDQCLRAAQYLII